MYFQLENLKKKTTWEIAMQLGEQYWNGSKINTDVIMW
jgi:hypothetical protein